MDKRRLTSLSLQGLYLVIFIAEIVICIIYRNSFDAEAGRMLAEIALHLMGILFLVPAMPISLILNIFILLNSKSDSVQRKKWLSWTIVSPILYVCLSLVACCVFVATTGGV